MLRRAIFGQPLERLFWKLLHPFRDDFVDRPSVLRRLILDWSVIELTQDDGLQPAFRGDALLPGALIYPALELFGEI